MKILDVVKYGLWVYISLLCLWIVIIGAKYSLHGYDKHKRIYSKKNQYSSNNSSVLNSTWKAGHKEDMLRSSAQRRTPSQYSRPSFENWIQRIDNFVSFRDYFTSLEMALLLFKNKAGGEESLFAEPRS